jgi:hypothetical protein
MSKEMSEHEAAEEWEHGEDIDLGPIPDRRMSLLTIRIDSATLSGLIQLAKKEGTGPTIEARKILQEGVQARIDMPFEATVRQAMESAKRAVESILENGYTPTSTNMMNKTSSYAMTHAFTYELKKKEENEEVK